MPLWLSWGYYSAVLLNSACSACVFGGMLKMKGGYIKPRKWEKELSFFSELQGIKWVIAIII